MPNNNRHGIVSGFTSLPSSLMLFKSSILAGSTTVGIPLCMCVAVCGGDGGRSQYVLCSVGLSVLIYDYVSSISAEDSANLGAY